MNEEENNSGNETPIWRILLSVMLFCYTSFSLFNKCSKNNSREAYRSENQMGTTFPNDIMAEKAADFMAERAENSNDLFYKPFKEIDKLSDELKQKYGLIKLKKDTLISLDLATKIKIEKKSYFQNNHDDSLRYASKSPDGLITFFHNFPCSGSAVECFRTLKKDKNISNLKVDNSDKSSPLYTYVLKSGKTKINGCAMVFQDKDVYFFEFESKDLSPQILKLLALEFSLTKIIVDNKSAIERL